MHFMTLFLKFHWSGRKGELMNIQYRYEPSSRYSSGNVTEVYANDAPIGILESLTAASEQLSWNPDDRVYNVPFQFRNEDTFLSVVSELKRFKDEQGYKYLTIWTYNNGYATQINKNLLEKAGFKNIPDQNPACMFLE